MKLLVDCHCFDFNMSQGITTYIEGIYKILPRLAMDINIYFVAKDVDKIKKIFGEASNIQYIPLVSRNRIYRLLFEIPNIIKNYGIDLAHFQYVSPLIKNCKTIVTLHDILFVDYPEYFPLSYRVSKRPFFYHSAKKADLLCTVSNYSRSQISNHYNIPKDNIYITPNAVSKEFLSIDEGRIERMPEKYLLYVSRIEPRKNHISILESYLRLRLYDEGYYLVFIGKETVDTPELHNALNLLSQDIKEKVIPISQANFSDLKKWYKNADLFLYPSKAEGFGIPPIEASVAGVPVICNDKTAMSDFKFYKEDLIDFENKDLLDSRILYHLSRHSNKEVDLIKNEILSKYNWESIAYDFNQALNRFRL